MTTRSPLHALALALVSVGLVLLIVLAVFEGVYLTYKAGVAYGLVAALLGFVAFWTLRWVWNHYQLGET